LKCKLYLITFVSQTPLSEANTPHSTRDSDDEDFNNTSVVKIDSNSELEVERPISTQFSHSGSGSNGSPSPVMR
jgi:hypothetical protein